MDQSASQESIRQLEQRHEHLIGELDALNTRLEHALNSLVRTPSASDRDQQTAANEPPPSFPDDSVRSSM